MKFKKLYNYSVLVPILVLLLSLGILINGYFQTGEWFKRSIELKGGNLISFSPKTSIDVKALEKSLLEFGSSSVREIHGFSGYRILIETEPEINTTLVLNTLKEKGIEADDISIETIGPSLGESFWKQAQIGVILAFVFMGIIVFLIFRTFAPSLAVILAAVSDILCTLAFMQIFGISLSLAGLAALLMLIGYSIDTDILLTTRLLKSSTGKLEERLKNAFKTGLTMTGTTVAALSCLYISSISPVLSQIAAILLIGLVLDLINTWLQNAVILKWYCERKGL